MADGLYENFLGPFTVGELLDPIEHVFRDHNGDPMDLQGEQFTGVAYALTPSGQIRTYDGQVLSGGRVAALVRPLDEVGIWRIQLWAGNADDAPSETDLRLVASWHFVFDVQPGIFVAPTP